ncbi:phosphoribosylformimino-5-aminoimidazole carboxamide ribotide isomerase [Breznakia sp. PF5-3]|uniref:1-(5-phosphoribosyl)-5-[(5- phosphoribosylamino)methylideneamino]imidazole-4- carboxamide isomerase n=1 Tax=unclassified Breznakia TaxID=2623764 RepID=UPI00240628A3|nr:MULTISPECIES: 1-(5-phosphoribosyl)-5-[(5-phosphoribosylamino)methylideneamino]imidazole-4-carboxamide isomerase [unclassified Breznakia]MDF9825642.1 phosphoribosylformimino-5-aminoimidazole carboxamide ribotide isomerase [Breznakia sp. PM6-1]MDF9836480.1 phosphoribosylformimino-5-aminoimidazole carboxamide ribotide isomerase [Breznakia sp. PF5-3]MDF9838675.1 phosphoribosylformimino-5-aminoimidazole carboxamide ribotide isomerase [Breznakia sp. PFB2-8]MDF9860700.1 phosphoribosylformimino-5-am
MIILPAIDIIDSKPVRLYKGDYNQVEEVSGTVLEVAKTFETEGAQYLHIVDLDGAKDGSMVNKDLIIELVNQVTIPIEVGGGIRSMEAISYYLDHGVARIILGTSAIDNKDLLKEALEKYGDRIAVGIDFKDDYVYGRGWLEASNLHYVEFAKDLATLGVKTIIVTDISKDGTLEGPNVEMLKRLSKEVDINIIASGGIKDINDIKALNDIHVYGAITGKAMYHKTLDLKEALKISKGE